ncbi:SusC/RagA family TonB-linked outer membrane protein [Mongoliibacter ruber]|uniref:TonB-linked SusC/RagA family outer membrane protein n=1 Tax=Mongoliibacter ruber TaxID=1750599 RepID=A0A2T0WGE0_9BACT|nr:TonB-dependent receptor [Mongoliibacter ruber]PRY85771.1 TonB-linked SusC/RagA family outer membrane protein [Mongoliibacter ruber]
MLKTIYKKQKGKWSQSASLICLIFLWLTLFPMESGAQTDNQLIDVSGTVMASDSGESLPGVNVLIKGTTSGTATDIDGNFTLRSVSPNDVLVFSFIGYAPIERRVGNTSTFNVTMDPDQSSLSEIVIVGYGTQERAKVTGAISSITSENIRELPVPNLASAIQGRAAGVNVTNTGAPGTNPVVRIRGVGTVGNNDPLYVIDGVPAGGLNQINTADIESIEVLKDASAAAIYGSRAANGVILVTTKKGTKGKPVVTVDSYVGTQAAWRTLDLLGREDYLAFGRDLLGNAGDPPPQRFDNLGDLANVETNWQNEMFRTASIQDHNVGISGGNDNVLYNVSAGYFAQEGIMRGTDFERFSFRSNTEFKISNRVTVGQTLTIAYSNRNNEPFTGGRTQLEHIVKQVPYIPVRDESRLGGFRSPDRVDGSDPENPVLNADLRTNNTQDYKILGTAYLKVNILDGLDYKFLVGTDLAMGTTNEYTPRFRSGDFHEQPFAVIGQNRFSFFSPLISNQLNYQKTINKHSFDVLAVAEQQSFVSTSLSGSGQNFLTNEIRELQGVQNMTTSSNRIEYAILSFLGRFNYDYDQKYLFSASIRRDGGSRFGPANKWGTFPSISAGWRISEESFMQGLSGVSDLKIRASYGETGNDQIGDYVYQATINSNFFYPVAGSLESGSTISALANTDLRWETTIMKNIGIDLGLFNDSFNMSLELFDNRTEGMILGVPIPPSLGYDGAPVANVGTVSNRGIELALGYRKYSGDFQFSVDGNIGFVQNELVSLGSGNTIFGPEFQGDPLTFTEEGKPIGYFYGWQTDGLFQQGQESSQQPNASPGDIRFVDVNGDGTIDANDRTFLGHYLPDFTYGLNFSANYKNFDFSMFVQGVYGNQIFNLLRFHTEGMTRLFNASEVVLDRWTPENTNTDVPRAVNGDPNRNARASSRWIEDGSYLRIKNLSLGYNVPTPLLDQISKGSISKVRLYVAAQNLLTITNYTGYDPEIAARTGINTTLGLGIDYGQYPAPRTFTGGIQLSF